MTLTVEPVRRHSLTQRAVEAAPLPNQHEAPKTEAPAAFEPALAPPHDLVHRDAKQSDGWLVGLGGLAHPPGTPLASIPAIEPTQGGATKTVIHVNGIMCNPRRELADLQALADATAARVVGVYNATDGLVPDLLQCQKDKLDRGHNPAVDAVAGLIESELAAGRSVHLTGHSQGALVASRALEDVRGRLLQAGRTPAEVQALLAKVTVETFGGAASWYPDGPAYTHYVDRADFVPRELGLGEVDPPLRDLTPKVLGVDTHPGAGATVVQFDDGSFLDRLNPAGRDHRLTSYLQFRVPPEQAASHPQRVEVQGAQPLWKQVVRAVASPLGVVVGWARGLLE